MRTLPNVYVGLINFLAKNFRTWAKNYDYSPLTNEFSFKGFEDKTEQKMAKLFEW